MSRTLRFFAPLALLACGLLLLIPQPAVGTSAGASHNDVECAVIIVDTAVSVYQGDGQVVVTPSGNRNFTCHCPLVSGPGVDKTVHIEIPDCKIVVNGNIANWNCHP